MQEVDLSQMLMRFPLCLLLPPPLIALQLALVLRFLSPPALHTVVQIPCKKTVEEKYEVLEESNLRGRNKGDS